MFLGLLRMAVRDV